MSFRQVIFTSSQNVKPPLLYQYLIFFDDLFFTLEIYLVHYFNQKNQNLKKIADLKVYGNLNVITEPITAQCIVPRLICFLMKV